MAKKKKTLPKDFGEILEAKDFESFKKVFETCEIDARGGYGKTTALSFYRIPNEFVRWLVAQGADLEAVDNYKRTALHEQASIRGGDVSVFLELGANVNAVDTYGSTPMHFATGHGFNVDAVKKLIEYGADVKALDDYKQTPLESALGNARNMDLPALAEISKILLSVDSNITQKMKDDVIKKGEDFEFHREGFNKDFLQETDEALDQLYEIFNVPPVKRRLMHDGVSPIKVSGNKWQEQYEELWELLIPSSGSAKTVQGEVVRIAGKVRDEIHRNGGANWGADFKKMLDAFGEHLKAGNSLATADLEKADLIIKDIRKNGDGEDDELHFLCELATKWVNDNPNPILMDKPNYKR